MKKKIPWKNLRGCTYSWNLWFLGIFYMWGKSLYLRIKDPFLVEVERGSRVKSGSRKSWSPAQSIPVKLHVLNENEMVFPTKRPTCFLFHFSKSVICTSDRFDIKHEILLNFRANSRRNGTKRWFWQCIPNLSSRLTGDLNSQFNLYKSTIVQ